MIDPTDAAGTHRYAPVYVALGGYLLACAVVAVGLHRLGLTGVVLAVAIIVVAAALLWVAFLPLFRRLSDGGVRN